MKYAIIIPDGAADHPLDNLDGRTPFEVADKPHTDCLSIDGRQGTVVTTPPNFPCGSDVCSMSLLGYDPARYHTGRAPLEAAALGLEPNDTDWIFRVNLVTVVDGMMQDHSAGHISDVQARQLIADLTNRLPLDRMTLHPGVSYRNIMIDRSGDRDWSSLKTTPPHDIPGQLLAEYLPVAAPHADLLRDIIETSAALLADHEINNTRRKQNQLPATHLWPWGQGTRPVIDSFKSRFGLRGAMITAVDLLAGIAAFIGWDRLAVPGQTSYHDTDYAAAGQYAIEALDRYDIVCVHIEAPDEAAHAADAQTKIAAIEAIDRHIVGPMHDAVTSTGNGYRILYLPDHYTAVATRKHDPTPVPFIICGTRITGRTQKPFNEANAIAADLKIEHGHELMQYFLRADGA